MEATRFTQRAAEAAYQRGLTSRLQATEARLPVLAEEMSLLMLDSRRVIQSIQLMKSLGGGYQAGSRRREKIKCLPRDGCHAVFRFVVMLQKLTTACFSSEF